MAAEIHELQYRGRRAWAIEDGCVRVIVTVEGGHVAGIQHKSSGVDPLWRPPWHSIEPSTYDAAKHPEYGADAESKLLAGIMGHNLCLDLFGPPSPEEAAAGMTVHGEASIAHYDIGGEAGELVCRTRLESAQLVFARRIRLDPGGVVRFSETVENLSSLDRASAWTQHVTLGPPFLAKGATEFRVTATRSRTAGEVDFEWPFRPLAGGGSEDMRVFTDAPSSGDFSTHLMDPSLDTASFAAFSPTARVLFGYVWRRADFPWMGIWDENYSRPDPPWNGRTLTRGMEFGVSPFAETRRAMIDRGKLFGTPCYRWIPARTTLRAEYLAFIREAGEMPREASGEALVR